jgi:hypothetical protein
LLFKANSAIFQLCHGESLWREYIKVIEQKRSEFGIFPSFKGNSNLSWINLIYLSQSLSHHNDELAMIVLLDKTMQMSKHQKVEIIKNIYLICQTKV